MPSNKLSCVLAIFSTSRECSRNRSRSLLPVSPTYISLHRVEIRQKISFGEMHAKRSVLLTNCLRLEFFSAWRTKGQVLYRACAHLEVVWVLKHRPAELQFSTKIFGTLQ